MIKNINKSDLSASFGKQNRHSLIADIDKTLSTFNYVLSSMSLSCIVTDDIGKLSNLISDLNGGTVAIVSSLIVEGNEALSTRTAYALVKDEDGIHGHWEAFNGNYNAKNIYFDHNILMAGDYINVGAISKGSLTAVSEYNSKGMSLDDIMSNIFLKDSDDAEIKSPTINAYITSSTGEIGSKIKPTYKLVTTNGSYSYGSIDSTGTWVNGTGVTTNILSAKDTKGYENKNMTSNTEVTSTSEYQFTTSSLQILDSYYSWNSGNIPATKAHKKSTKKSPISANSNTAQASLPAGYIPIYLIWYKDNTSAPTTIDASDDYFKNATIVEPKNGIIINNISESQVVLLPEPGKWYKLKNGTLPEKLYFGTNLSTQYLNFYVIAKTSKTKWSGKKSNKVDSINTISPTNVQVTYQNEYATETFKSFGVTNAVLFSDYAAFMTYQD